MSDIETLLTAMLEEYYEGYWVGHDAPIVNAPELLTFPSGQALLAKVAALEGALRGANPWRSVDDGWPRCYACGVTAHHRHADGCEWAAALAGEA